MGADRRIRVNTVARAIVQDSERSVVVVGVSATSALFVTSEAAGLTGSTLTLFLPATNGEVELLSGIEQVDKIPDGFAITVAFIVVEQQTRDALNALMRLLLSGDGGGARTQPRVIYDVAIHYGPTLALYGRLEEISQRGAQLRIKERVAPGGAIHFAVPDFATQESLVLDARVVQQRLSKEGGYHTGVELVDLSTEMRSRLARLLADLLCR